MQGKKRPADNKAGQPQRFREAAKLLEVDESGEVFERALSVIVKSPPKKSTTSKPRK